MAAAYITEREAVQGRASLISPDRSEVPCRSHHACLFSSGTTTRSGHKRPLLLSAATLPSRDTSASRAKELQEADDTYATATAAYSRDAGRSRQPNR